MDKDKDSTINLHFAIGFIDTILFQSIKSLFKTGASNEEIGSIDVILESLRFKYVRFLKDS